MGWTGQSEPIRLERWRLFVLGLLREKRRLQEKAAVAVIECEDGNAVLHWRGVCTTTHTHTHTSDVCAAA